VETKFATSFNIDHNAKFHRYPSSNLVDKICGQIETISSPLSHFVHCSENA
jgi:hypothetical protein